jgi:hypothetical protein
MKSITSIVRELLFDKDLVNNMKGTKLNKDILYTHLISGKITIHEYISLL